MLTDISGGISEWLLAMLVVVLAIVAAAAAGVVCYFRMDTRERADLEILSEPSEL